MNLEQLKGIMKNLIRKIPETKYEEILNMFNKEKYLINEKEIIDKRVDDIVSNNHRKSYFKAAILVVALSEVLESNKIQDKNEFINLYHKKYSRRTLFKDELNKYK